MASLAFTTLLAAACAYYAVRAHWASQGLVHPVYKVRVCSQCALRRDASAFPTAASTTCVACRQCHDAAPKPRPPGRKRLLTAQIKRIQRECKPCVKPLPAQACRELLGVTDADELWHALSSKLRDGMTEDNYGQWHVDHIVPVALFNLGDADQRKRCFHHANLAPMWASDNLAKGSCVKPPDAVPPQS